MSLPGRMFNVGWGVMVMSMGAYLLIEGTKTVVRAAVDKDVI